MSDTLVTLAAGVTVAGTSYRILSAESREALSEVPRLACELTDDAGGPDPAALVGKAALFTLARSDGSARRAFAGVVVAAEVTHGTHPDEGETATRVEIAPRLHRLGERSDCRAFHGLSTPDIVEQVLSGAGIPPTAQRRELAQRYPARDYTVQYRESDLDFVRRLLAEEGIAFAVSTADDQDVVTFTDGDLGLIEGASSLPFDEGFGFQGSRDLVTNVSEEHAVVSDSVTLRDHDFEHPRLTLEARAASKAPGAKTLEVYAYPGRFTDPGVGERYAQVLLDAIQAGRQVIIGETGALTLHPGRRFSLTDHPYAPLDREYLILAVELGYAIPRRGGRDPVEGGCHLRFTAVPAGDSPYRPPRIQRDRVVPGLHTARITGAPGSEIFPDRHGRVKALFPWDRLGKRDDHASAWMRTSQLALGGSMLTPRVGFEVSVARLEGDADRPMVTGRLYNPLTPPPYALPRHKARSVIQTATTPGGGSHNEIRLDDTKGSEEMSFNASKDMAVSAGNNATESIGGNESRAIGANQELDVTGSLTASVGATQATSVAGNQSAHASTFLGEEVGGGNVHGIGGNRDLTIGGDHKRGVTGASTLTIGGNQIDLVAGSVSESTMATMTDTIGAVQVTLTASKRTLLINGARTETTGAVKVVVAGGGRSVKIGTTLTHRVAGAILVKTKAGRTDAAKGKYTEVAGGAQIIKAANVVFEAKELLSVVMGASTITLTPASVSIAGTSIELDGEVSETAALVSDN